MSWYTYDDGAVDPGAGEGGSEPLVGLLVYLSVGLVHVVAWEQKKMFLFLTLQYANMVCK